MRCAIYRIVIQGWTREKALREMTRVANFHEIWVNPSRIFRSSTDRIRRRVGQDWRNHSLYSEPKEAGSAYRAEYLAQIQH